MIEMSKLEKALGGKLETHEERRIPGLDDDESVSTIYFAVPSGKSAKTLFRKITNYTNPPFAQSGGATEAGCIISTSSNLVFHALEVHGDLAGWCADIEAGAAAENILLANVQNDQLLVRDGQTFALEDCQVTFT
ncbi:MAG: hypothetical protein ABJ375_13080 [Rhizobiaceae bacterium]